MKLLTIIKDAASSIHIEATRAPDLRRRQISQETGSAEILFCAAPPEGESAQKIAGVLQEILLESGYMSGDALRAQIKRAAVWHIFIRPSLNRWKCQVRKPLMHLVRALHGRTPSIA